MRCTIRENVTTYGTCIWKSLLQTSTHFLVKLVLCLRRFLHSVIFDFPHFSLFWCSNLFFTTINTFQIDASTCIHFRLSDHQMGNVNILYERCQSPAEFLGKYLFQRFKCYLLWMVEWNFYNFHIMSKFIKNILSL